MAFEARCYHNLINARHESAYDDRVSAIELQLNAPLSLSKATKAVVLPDAFAVAEVLEPLEAANVAALPYDYVPRLRPDSYTAEIYRLVRDYYRRRGYL